MNARSPFNARYLRGVLCALAAVLPASLSHADEERLREQGRLIYEEGITTSGAALVGRRPGGANSVGKYAACKSCHQRSGFGQFEGGRRIPPITGKALFATERPPLALLPRGPGVSYKPAPYLVRPAYDDVTLLAALRDGVGAGGYTISSLMPRYDLDEGSRAALFAYLRTLSAEPSPGTTPKGTRFATALAPGYPPERQRLVIETLQACFKDRKLQRESNENWTLDVWRLEGAPETWSRQLEAFYAKAPPFAMLSGLGGADWSPVDAFCQEKKLPCFFPNVDAVKDVKLGGYAFYFSRGVLLEADIAARYILDAGQGGVRRVVGIVGNDPAAAEAARRLQEALAGKPVSVETLSFQEIKSKGLAGIDVMDAVVLWLRPDELAYVSRLPIPRARIMVVSGWLGGFETAPLSQEWMQSVELILVVDAPIRRELRARYNLSPWFASHGIKVVDPILQGNTLAACKVISESAYKMLGNYVRDYLVEFVENYPVGMGNAPAAQAYPRFIIAPGERLTSRGAYIARFGKSNPRELQLARDWFTP